MPEWLLSSQTLATSGGGGSHSHSLSAPPRSGGAAITRGKTRRSGMAFHSRRGARPPSSAPRPQRAGPPAPAPTLGPQHPAQACRPAHAHPGQGPSALPELDAVPRYLWGRRERPQSKRSKEKKEGQGPGDSPGGGVDTKRAGKPPGVARGLQAHPRSRLPFPPLPRLPDPFQGSSFLLPSAPARGSVLGIKRKEGGEKGGKGKGRRRKEDDPSKGGC